MQLLSPWRETSVVGRRCCYQVRCRFVSEYCWFFVLFEDPLVILLSISQYHLALSIKAPLEVRYLSLLVNVLLRRCSSSTDVLAIFCLRWIACCCWIAWGFSSTYLFVATPHGVPFSCCSPSYDFILCRASAIGIFDWRFCDVNGRLFRLSVLLLWLLPFVTSGFSWYSDCWNLFIELVLRCCCDCSFHLFRYSCFLWHLCSLTSTFVSTFLL
jgi:hypothetical protein